MRYREARRDGQNGGGCYGRVPATRLGSCTSRLDGKGFSRWVVTELFSLGPSEGGICH